MSRFYESVKTQIRLKNFCEQAKAAGETGVGYTASGTLYTWDGTINKPRTLTPAEAAEFLHTDADQIQKLIAAATQGKEYTIQDPEAKPVIEETSSTSPAEEEVAPPTAPTAEEELPAEPTPEPEAPEPTPEAADQEPDPTPESTESKLDHVIVLLETIATKNDTEIIVTLTEILKELVKANVKLDGLVNLQVVVEAIRDELILK